MRAALIFSALIIGDAIAHLSGEAMTQSEEVATFIGVVFLVALFMDIIELTK